MINRMLAAAIRGILSLRYRVDVRGLEDVASRGLSGILFLPNHPALIDPVIMMSLLVGRFSPRTLADRRQVDRFLIRRLARRVGVLTMPDASRDEPGAAAQIEARVAQAGGLLASGLNLLIYPAGRVYRKRLEDLGGNSAVQTLLRIAPQARVVLVRTRGLWGSRFSWAQGHEPDVGAVVRKGIGPLLAGGIFFMPRRKVTIEFVEPPDLPRQADRMAFNQYLERFYNQDAPPNTYVPLMRGRGPRSVVRPEPEISSVATEASEVEQTVRQRVIEHLRALTGRADIRDSQRLDADLGLDSLARMDLGAWLRKEYASEASPAGFETVADVLLAASGLSAGPRGVSLQPPPAAWQVRASDRRVTLGDAADIAQAFARQARMNPGMLIVADQISGAKSYRDLVRGILLLQPALKKLDGEFMGVMLPAGVAADLAYLAAVFAGKTPVMLNWTVGLGQMRQSLGRLDVRCVLTSRRLADRLKHEGLDLDQLGGALVYLEDIAAAAGRLGKLRVLVQSISPWRRLAKMATAPLAAVLFTSGSEATPKAVGLTHENILSNIRAALEAIHVRRDECLLSMLPPFHAFGLTVGTVLPLCVGMRTCYHANPTEGAILAAMAANYSASMVFGTPTFLEGMVRWSRPGQLATLRLVVTGAEKCPPRVYDAIRQAAPSAAVLEGYGVTECSPIVAVNDADRPVAGAIGKVLPSFEHVLVDPDADMTAPLTASQIVPAGDEGMLLVRGASVFGGYLKHTGPQPFVELGGKSWYCTGDVVKQDADGVLTFVARRRRFIKLGGEMVSLAAVESVLEEHFPPDDSEAGKPPRPRVAIVATQADRPQIVLATTLDLSVEAVNSLIARAGLSPLHYVRRMAKLEDIPLLGTGKIDYPKLQALVLSG